MSVSALLAKAVAITLERVRQRPMPDSTTDQTSTRRDVPYSPPPLHITSKQPQYPIVNAAYDPSGAIKYNPEINVAMAVALDGGLITPTLRNANKMDLISLGAKWRELVKKAQEKRLAPDEYSTGACFGFGLGLGSGGGGMHSCRVVVVCG